MTQHVSAAVLSSAPAVAGDATRWRTIFSSQPCVPMAPAFDPFESGGRLVRRADGTLLLTLGDYGLLDVRGVDSTGRPSDYGAVHAIAPDGSRSIFTTGHRNAQGLTIDHLGRIWSTEHGPRGGDEINLLRPRGDYGFPGTTYGTQYGSFVWPFTADTAVAARSIPAVHTFVPSIGISNLLNCGARRFHAGDTICSSLRSSPSRCFACVLLANVWRTPNPSPLALASATWPKVLMDASSCGLTTVV